MSRTRASVYFFFLLLVYRQVGIAKFISTGVTRFSGNLHVTVRGSDTWTACQLGPISRLVWKHKILTKVYNTQCVWPSEFIYTYSWSFRDSYFFFLKLWITKIHRIVARWLTSETAFIVVRIKYHSKHWLAFIKTACSIDRDNFSNYCFAKHRRLQRSYWKRADAQVAQKTNAINEGEKISILQISASATYIVRWEYCISAWNRARRISL